MPTYLVRRGRIQQHMAAMALTGERAPREVIRLSRAATHLLCRWGLLGKNAGTSSLLCFIDLNRTYLEFLSKQTQRHATAHAHAY